MLAMAMAALCASTRRALTRRSGMAEKFSASEPPGHGMGWGGRFDSLGAYLPRRRKRRTATSRPAQPTADAAALETAPLRRAEMAPAWATASAVMLTTRRTVADGVRMCAGAPTPSRIGPTVTP